MFTLSPKFKTRADLKKTAGHTDLWQEINQENVERIIPKSMSLFLSLHFEGIDCIFKGFEGESVGKCGAKRAIKT